MAPRRTGNVDALLWIAAIGIAVGAAYLMLAPEPPGAGAIPSWTAHFLIYFAQTTVTLLAAVWRPGGPPRKGASAALVVTAVVVYATALEVAQWAIPERRTEPADFVVNGIGAVIGFTAWHLGRARAAARPGSSL